MNSDVHVLVGGEILATGPFVLWAAKHAAADAQQLRRDGVRGALVEEWARDLDVAARRVMSSALGRAEVPPAVTVPPSRLIDPIDVQEASVILKCGPRNVRDLCKRGALETAHRDGGSWRIERAEVVTRAGKAAS